jgi:hypothetical protein
LEIRHWGNEEGDVGIYDMFLGKWVVRWVNFTQFWGGGFWYEFF